jgi:hypothetical protein
VAGDIAAGAVLDIMRTFNLADMRLFNAIIQGRVEGSARRC